MSDYLVAAVIASLPPTLVAVLAWWRSIANGVAISEINVKVNGRLDKLIELAEAKGYTAGLKKGRRGG